MDVVRTLWFTMPLEDRPMDEIPTARAICDWPGCDRATTYEKWLCATCWHRLTPDEKKAAYWCLESYQAGALSRDELDARRAAILRLKTKGRLF